MKSNRTRQWRLAIASLCVATMSALAGCAATGGGAGTAALSPTRIAQIVASPDRSAADRTNDQRRKPEQMLAFIGVRPGITALDLSAGGGYTTELLARAAGPTGKVYGQSRPGPSFGPRPSPVALAVAESSVSMSPEELSPSPSGILPCSNP